MPMFQYSPSWTRRLREGLATALHWSGALLLLERVSRHCEVLPGPGPFHRRFRAASKPRLAVLCYHRVGSGGIPFYSWLDPEVFEGQIRYLRRHYRIVSLDTLFQEFESCQTNEPAVAITFDDGYRDVYNHAFPILRKYQVPATIYLTAASIETGQVAWYDRIFLALQVADTDTLDLVLDRPRRFLLSSPAARLRVAEEMITWLRKVPDAVRKEQCIALERRFPLPEAQLRDRMLNWDQVRTMAAAEINFGSHTLSHPVVSRLLPAELERELIDSRRMIESRINRPVLDFAYPFGKAADYGDVPRVVANCGYRSGVTTNWGLNRPETSRYELRRVSIGPEHSPSMFAFKLAQLFLSADEEHGAAAGPDPTAVKEQSLGSNAGLHTGDG